MRIVPERECRPRTSKNRIIGIWAPEFTLYRFLAGTNLATSSSQWFSASDPAAFPFVVNEYMTVDRLGWLNGSAPGGNLDVGIYDTSFNRLISTGNTVGSGASVWQWVDVTNTVLNPGTRYYLAMSMDNVTANRITNFTASAGIAINAFYGVQDSATNASPLPNPLTNMAAAATINRLPVVAMATRAPF